MVVMGTSASLVRLVGVMAFIVWDISIDAFPNGRDAAVREGLTEGVVHETSSFEMRNGMSSTHLYGHCVV